jgi:hypothetical protein
MSAGSSLLSVVCCGERRVVEVKLCSEVKSCSQLENNFYRGIELENILYRDIENLKISSTIRVGVLK